MGEYGRYSSSEADIRLNLSYAKDYEESARRKQEKVDIIIEVSKYYSGYYKRKNKKIRWNYIADKITGIIGSLIGGAVLISALAYIGIKIIGGFIGLMTLICIPGMILIALGYFFEALGDYCNCPPWRIVNKEWKQYLNQNPDIAKAAYDYYMDKSSITPFLAEIKQDRENSYKYRKEAGIGINESPSILLKMMNNGYTLNEARKEWYRESGRIQAQVEENRRRMDSDWKRQQNYNNQIDDLRAANEEADRNADERYRDYVYRKKIDDSMKNSK